MKKKEGIKTQRKKETKKERKKEKDEGGKERILNKEIIDLYINVFVTTHLRSYRGKRYKNSIRSIRKLICEINSLDVSSPRHLFQPTTLHYLHLLLLKYHNSI